MESQSSSKKNIFIVLLSVLIVALILAVILQQRHISELNGRLNGLTLSEKVDSGLNEQINLSDTDTRTNRRGKKKISPSSEKVEFAESDSNDNEQIKKLKAQIADMQEWQDYLEDTVEKRSKEEEERDKSLRKSIKSYLTTRLQPFFDHNNISPEIKSRIIDLRLEEQVEMEDIYKSGMPSKDTMEEQVKAQKEYEERIAELLSEKDYTAYKNFKKLEYEWGTVGQIKRDFVSRDLKLEKDQEQQLVEAMHDARMEVSKIQSQKMLKKEDYEKLSQEERMKQSLEYQKTMYGMYLESASKILSESQYPAFKRYFDNQIYMIERSYASMSAQLSDEADEEESGE